MRNTFSWSGKEILTTPGGARRTTCRAAIQTQVNCMQIPSVFSLQPHSVSTFFKKNLEVRKQI